MTDPAGTPETNDLYPHYFRFGKNTWGDVVGICEHCHLTIEEVENLRVPLYISMNRKSREL